MGSQRRKSPFVSQIVCGIFFRKSGFRLRCDDHQPDLCFLCILLVGIRYLRCRNPLSSKPFVAENALGAVKCRLGLPGGLSLQVIRWIPSAKHITYRRIAAQPV